MNSSLFQQIPPSQQTPSMRYVPSSNLQSQGRSQVIQMEKEVVIPYRPRAHQQVIHKQLESFRWAVLVLHRRFGKTVMLLNHIVKDAMLTKKERPRYAYIAPFLKQAKTVAWDYLKYYCDPIPGRVFGESELKVDLPNGARIRLFGADNADALRGIYLDGCVLDEYAQIDDRLFSSVIRPALSDRLGWCIFSGTPNGKNHFYDLLMKAENEPDWYHCVLQASETGVIDTNELENARKTMSQEEYEREYECSFNSLIGKKIYPEFNRKLHVTGEDLTPSSPCEVIRGWDNTGLSPACVLTYLTSWGQWRIFKEFCFEDTGIMEAAEAVITWCNMMLPNGTRYRDYADPAGRIRDTSKMSARDYLMIKAREMGHDMLLVDGIQSWKPRRESVANRLTKILNGQPALLVSEYGCPVLVEGFEGGYAYREIANLPGMYAEEAIKNKYSHCFTGDTLVSTPFGKKRIDTIDVGDLVSTPNGCCEVTAVMSAYVPKVLTLEFSNGDIITCTGDHPFYTEKGIILADSLWYDDNIIHTRRLSWANLTNMFRRSSMESSITENLGDITNLITRNTVGNTYTGWYGNTIMGQYQQVQSSIILMGTNQIITLAIYRYFLMANTLLIIVRNGLQSTRNLFYDLYRKLSLKLQNGIDLMLVWHGIRNTVKRLGIIEKQRNSYVLYVVKHIKDMRKSENLDIVVKTANKLLGVGVVSMMKLGIAQFVEITSRLTNILEPKRVVTLVRKHQENRQCQVYDLTVNGEHCFFVGDGEMLVSNCHDSLQYIATRLFLNNSNIRSTNDGKIILDEDEEMYQYSTERTGRSFIGGY